MWLYLAVLASGAAPRAGEALGNLPPQRASAEELREHSAALHDATTTDAPIAVAVGPGGEVEGDVEVTEAGGPLEDLWYQRLSPRAPPSLLQKLSDANLLQLTACASGAAVLLVALMIWWVHARRGDSLPQGDRSFSELTGLGAFKAYSGFLMCTWLPFVLAVEGERLLPSHQSLFMGIGKLILAVAMSICPIFGLMNDETMHVWGRRRVWFLAGVVLITTGIAVCAFSSIQKWPAVYLVGTAFWCFGESAAESTTEALIPDYCNVQEYMRAASIRGVLFALGGFAGYGFIILSAIVVQWPVESFYLYYLLFVLVTAPCALAYAPPTDAERKALAKRDQPADQPADAEGTEEQPAPAASGGYIKRCIIDCWNCGQSFRVMAVAMWLLSCSNAGVMFVLLVVRDMAGVDDSGVQQVHMALISMCLMGTAAMTSVTLGCCNLGQRSGFNLMIFFIIVNALTEMTIPLCVYGQDVRQRLYALYICSSVKGVAFGGMYNLMQPFSWEAIPIEWRTGLGAVARATTFISGVRSFGVGFGNFACGIILDVARAYGSNPTQENYPFYGYMLMFFYCALMGLAACAVVWSSRQLFIKSADV
jgi:MFS family permease